MQEIDPRSWTERGLTNRIWIIWSLDQCDWLILFPFKILDQFLASCTQGLTERSGRKSGYTNAGRRFMAVDDRPDIKANRSARLGPPTHLRVRLLVIRPQYTENNCDWVFSIAIESTRLPDTFEYRDRAFSFSVERTRLPDIIEYWDRVFSIFVERTWLLDTS